MIPEELVLALVAFVPRGPLPAAARVPASAFAGLQGTRDRRAPARARGAASAGGSTAADDRRSRFAYCGEPAVAAVELVGGTSWSDQDWNWSAYGRAAVSPPLNRS